MIELHETPLSGCFEVQPTVRGDERGAFIKTFQSSVFAEAGLETSYPEHFFSHSRKNVVRGLHFQLPPKDQHKYVFCTWGEVFDVAIDLRKGSPTYGRHHVFHLSAQKWNAAYIPKGFAHGFAVLSAEAVMGYFVSEEFVPDLDSGIRWDSLDIDWPVSSPILSAKDASLVAFEDWITPWSFE